jgi:hypothetical protein
MAGAVFAKSEQKHLIQETEWDAVGDVEGTAPVASKALQDTIWIADWNFEPGGVCSESGWVKYDFRDSNDGSNYWCVTADYDTCATLVGNSVRLGRHFICWEKDGYGNNWDYSIVLKYRGGVSGGGTQPTLAFSYACDSEASYDFITVECDSLGLSEALSDPVVDPGRYPATERDEIFSTDGLVANGTFGPMNLIDYTPNNSAAVHEVYIRFEADGGYSDEDGNYPTLYDGALLVDNISVGGTLVYTENFTGASGCANPVTGVITGVNANITFINSAPDKPFGQWARVFNHVTDNDKCSENTTCAWLTTDPSLPAYFSDMAFGPGGTVIRNWLDDIAVSPWASLATTQDATGTVISWRRFPGNDFSKGWIVEGWRVRGKSRVSNTDTSSLTDSVDCIEGWGHASSFNSLTAWNWGTTIGDMSPYFTATSDEVQISLRRTDWQHLTGVPPPATLNTGPGPYDDRVRIGRRVLEGPVINEGIDSRSQSQDAFGAVQNGITPGQHHSPSVSATRRFDPVPFSEGTELGINSPGSANLITGDSIWVSVNDVRQANGIASVALYAAIVSGPHAGKVPPGATNYGGGFFTIAADSVRSSSGVAVANFWFADMPDDYLRGGDEVVYFWGATDGDGGFSSDPSGIPGDINGPTVASVAQAEELTQGLLGMSALPTIDWDPNYLAAVAASGDGDVDPTAEQITNSSQKNCILYFNEFTSRRRSGPLQRTSFMYTMDRSGYRGSYDVYDVQGYGNTNNQLGGRATVAHATGYALIVQDTGRLGTTTIPTGINNDTEKVDQAGWYRTWLASGVSSEAGTATLWIIGENVVNEKGTNQLFSQDFGLQLGNTNNGSGVLAPDVLAVANMTFENGCVGDFLAPSADKFSLAGGCPVVRSYDGLTPTTGTGTHRYRAGTVNSPYYAIVMNKDAALNWNTVMSSFGWFDIRDDFGGSPGRDEQDLLLTVLQCVLPAGCVEPLDPVGTDPTVDALPKVSALHQNVPNPFNPTTKISFDLARDGRVKLQVFDVSGRLVKTLVNAQMAAGAKQQVTWNGLNEAGKRVSSGVYFYQLVTDDFTATKKMVVLK